MCNAKSRASTNRHDVGESNWDHASAPVSNCHQRTTFHCQSKFLETPYERGPITCRSVVALKTWDRKRTDIPQGLTKPPSKQIDSLNKQVNGCYSDEGALDHSSEITFEMVFWHTRYYGTGRGLSNTPMQGIALVPTNDRYLQVARPESFEIEQDHLEVHLHHQVHLRHNHPLQSGLVPTQS